MKNIVSINSHKDKQRLVSLWKPTQGFARSHITSVDQIHYVKLYDDLKTRTVYSSMFINDL